MTMRYENARADFLASIVESRKERFREATNFVSVRGGSLILATDRSNMQGSLCFLPNPEGHRRAAQLFVVIQSGLLDP
eukprot:891813-Amphidinium_carterae.2